MDLSNKSKESILATASSLRWEIGENFHDSLMETIFQNAARISDKTVSKVGAGPKFSWDATLDRILTSRWTGFPMMLLMLTVVFWITIEGANVPSGMLAALLIDTFHPALKNLAASVGMPWWLDGFLIDGIYLAMAWVVSVMLPPMMIFFHCSPCLKILAICRASLSTSTTCLENPAHTASRRFPWQWGTAALLPG